MIKMAEITWYILNELDLFLQFMRSEFPQTHLIHLLTKYPEGIQKYGKNKFSNLKQSMSYFDSNYAEWGEISSSDMEEGKNLILRSIQITLL